MEVTENSDDLTLEWGNESAEDATLEEAAEDEGQELEGPPESEDGDQELEWENDEESEEEPEEEGEEKAPYSFKLKVDGEEFERSYDEETIVTALQKAEAAEKRMAEAHNVRQRAQQFAESLLDTTLTEDGVPRGMEEFIKLVAYRHTGGDVVRAEQMLVDKYLSPMADRYMAEQELPDAERRARAKEREASEERRKLQVQEQAILERQKQVNATEAITWIRNDLQRGETEDSPHIQLASKILRKDLDSGTVLTRDYVLSTLKELRASLSSSDRTSEKPKQIPRTTRKTGARRSIPIGQTPPRKSGRDGGAQAKEPEFASTLERMKWLSQQRKR